MASISLTNRMPHVVVIGAGTAGLTVAKQLSLIPGFKTTVLEATSRIGGRIKSVNVGDTLVDVGASWMHETRFNPLFEEALRQKWPMKYTDKTLKYFTESGEIPTSAGIAQCIREMESIVAEYFHQGKPLLETEPSLEEFVNRHVLNCLPLLTEKERFWAGLMYRQVEHFIGQKWSEIPAGEGGDPSPLGRDAFVLGEGYEQVIDWLRREINWENTVIRLKEPVTCIRSIADDRFEVVTRTDHVYDADYVVCTVPLGALKTQATNLFSEVRGDTGPVLTAVSRTSSAFLGKVIVQFPTVEWDTSTDIFCVAHQERGDLVSIVNPFNSSVLVALTGPDLTQRVESDPENAYNMIEWAFQSITNGEIKSPAQVVVSDWSQSEYFQGSYSARSVGQTYDELVNAFINGIGKLRFAGEHTTLEGNGCVHGAYLSGIREAEFIIENETKHTTPKSEVQVDQLNSDRL